MANPQPQPKPKLDVENPNDDEEVPSVKVVCEQYYPPIESDTEGENDDNNTAIEEPIDDQHMNSSDSQVCFCFSLVDII